MKNLKILILLSLCAASSASTLNSQPTVDWRSYTWIGHDYNSSQTVSQRASDYDWWYDHCTGYQNPISKTNHIGYIACGVGKYRGNFIEPLTYNERGSLYNGQYTGGCAYGETPLFKGTCGEYDYSNFENPVSGKMGLGFNQIGRINPDGTLNYLITMNYDGEYMRTKQLQDGTFLTVGHSKSTRKKSGMPLYYNPRPNNQGSLFNYGEIFKDGICQRNVPHWDIMKFDGSDGTCLFNFIYGIYDFIPSYPFITYHQLPSNCCPQEADVKINKKQLCYLSSGQSFDFVQEPNLTGNIAVVGSQSNHQAKFTGKAAIIKIDNNGKILRKRFVDTSTDLYPSTARAVEFATINGVDYYIIAVTKSIVPYYGEAVVNIYKIPTTLNSAPVLIHQFISPPNDDPCQNNGKQCTVWSMIEKGNKLYIPLITNCTHVWWADNVTGELRLEIIDLDLPSPSPPIISQSITCIQAYDLKARITDLSNGNFAVVSTVKREEWQSICPNTVIPNYILGTDCPGNQSNTGHWNTDAYVTEIDPTGQKIWEVNYDVDSPFDCADFPNATDKGGNPKRQECMYGISEGPDQGLILSGNSSDNLDDNYMLKLKPCIGPPICMCFDPVNMIVQVGSSYFNMTNGQTYLTTQNQGTVSMTYNGLCINAGCCSQNNNQLMWTVYQKQIYPSDGTESIYFSGNSSAIQFSAIFKLGSSLKNQYRIEIKHSCAGNNCTTTNLIIKSA